MIGRQQNERLYIMPHAACVARTKASASYQFACSAARYDAMLSYDMRVYPSPSTQQTNGVLCVQRAVLRKRLCLKECKVCARHQGQGRGARGPGGGEGCDTAWRTRVRGACICHPSAMQLARSIVSLAHTHTLGAKVCLSHAWVSIDFRFSHLSLAAGQPVLGVHYYFFEGPVGGEARTPQALRSPCSPPCLTRTYAKQELRECAKRAQEAGLGSVSAAEGEQRGRERADVG